MTLLDYEYYRTENGVLYHGDCLEILPHLEPVDLVLTDPPYPTEHTYEYKYNPEAIKYFDCLKCKQFIFWTPQDRDIFPLSYSCYHIWDKKVGVRSQFELIYERNGLNGYRIYSYYFINSTVAASFTGDTFTGHKSQKPKQLIINLLEDSKTTGTVLDPFLGSGTTAVACERLNRRWIGIEIEEKYCAIAKQRIENERKQRKLF